MKIEELKVIDIIPNNWNPNIMENKVFNALVEGISENKGNILAPIEVREHPTKKGKYEIIDGEHRYKALKVCNLEKAYCVINNLDDGYARLSTLSKNLIKGEHKVDLESELYKSILEAGISEEEIMNTIGLDKDELDGILSISEIDIADFQNDFEFPTEVEEESKEKEEVLKEITKSKIVVTEAQKNIAEGLSRFTGLQDTGINIALVSKYFEFQSENGSIDELILKSAKESLELKNNY